MEASGTKPTGHVPLRRCRVCRRQAPKAQLTRWVAAEGGGLQADLPQRLPGRGYYSCSEQCAAALPKTMKRR